MVLEERNYAELLINGLSYVLSMHCLNIYLSFRYSMI